MPVVLGAVDRGRYRVALIGPLPNSVMVRCDERLPFSIFVFVWTGDFLRVFGVFGRCHSAFFHGFSLYLFGAAEEISARAESSSPSIARSPRVTTPTSRSPSMTGSRRT